MPHYFVNNMPNVSGCHEVHHVGCIRLPVDKRYLGNFDDVREAVVEARRDFGKTAGCELCAKDFYDSTVETVRIEQLRLPLNTKISL